ncbi:MAG: NADH-quinone oxidoreductase subunit C, partial [Rhodospirillaceae bacterium]|nr:NADH-quinone oxidoreductase subunit C [Rhodospirillales bacterium]
MCTCPAARRPPRGWFTGSCSCRRRSGAPEPFCVVDLAQAVRAAVPDAVLETQRGGVELVLHAGRPGLPALMLALRDTPGLEFQQCMDICGVDWPERAERFDVVYNLLSLTRNHRLRVVVSAGPETPVPSMADIWPSATWFERECWDMYGVVFEGLSDLRRLLTDYGFEGHPLRKDFPL